MRIQSITLEHFRSYSAASVEFDESDVQVFVGPNGAGKTNILEAVSVLAFGRSCLGAEEADAVRWGAQYYRIRAMTADDRGVQSSLEVVTQLQPQRKRAFFIRDVRVAAADLAGLLPVVLFLPQDLELFTGSPARRRTFLHDILCQVSPEYRNALSVYQKVLKQRNTLLKKIAQGYAKEGDLAVWDDHLAREGALLVLRELELLKVLECTLREELSALGEGVWNAVALRYERLGTATDREGIETELRGFLMHYRDRDLLLQQTTAGPHRFDWVLEADGRPIETFASRGQQRAALLALLLIEVSYLSLQRGEKPVILLDDVFSELDPAHQLSLLSALTEHQVFITATHLPEGEIGNAAIYEVGGGNIRNTKLEIRNKK